MTHRANRMTQSEAAATKVPVAKLVKSFGAQLAGPKVLATFTPAALQPRKRRQRAAMALLVVTVLTMLIALAAYRFSFYMESQYRVARLNAEQLQARLSALSGLEYAAFLLEQPHTSRTWQEDLNDQQQSPLAAVPLLAESEQQVAGSEETSVWRFSLIAPETEATPGDVRTTLATGGSPGGNTADSLHHRFGLENESAKLPIPLLLQWERTNPGTARGALLRLPGATPPLVDQWLRRQGFSPSNSSSTGGFSGDSLVSRRSGTSNDIGSTTEAAAADRDQLQWLWYGGDLNQNYRLDPLELQLRERLLNDTPGGDLRVEANVESSIPQGWNRFLTWTSGQRNESSTGNRRINLNSSDLGQLHRQLLRSWPIEWANFVVALRQYGPSSSQSSSTTISAAAMPLNLARPGTYQLSSLLDVVDAQVVIGDSAAEKQTLLSPFSSDEATASNYIERLLDEACLDERPFVESGIDVTAAPLEVLAATPGLGAELAQSIVQRRATLDAGRKETIAWLYTEQLVDLAQLRNLQSYLIGRSDVFSGQAVGFRDSRTPVARYTAVIDARHIPARLLRQQQWHNWDRGFDLSTLGNPPHP